MVNKFANNNHIALILIQFSSTCQVASNDTLFVLKKANFHDDLGPGVRGNSDQVRILDQGRRVAYNSTLQLCNCEHISASPDSLALFDWSY